MKTITLEEGVTNSVRTALWAVIDDCGEGNHTYCGEGLAGFLAHEAYITYTSLPIEPQPVDYWPVDDINDAISEQDDLWHDIWEAH